MLSSSLSGAGGSPPVLAMALSFAICAICTDRVLRNRHRREAEERYKVKTERLARLLRDADDRLTWSATRLGKAIRDGQLSSLQVTLLFMQHLEIANLFTNSMVASRYDRAMLEAREADEVLDKHRKAGTRPESPFFGVPIFSKEVFEMPGMPFTAGVVALKNRVGRSTCFALGKVKDNGGVIVIGSGNISEQCMWMESSNHVYGRTNNVYDASRTVGGSSGGTAATVSALGSPFAITSDVGGSTRIPSLFNGLFGLKPTGGSVSNEGTTPSTINRVNWFCQLGPCARHAEDLLPLLKLLAGPALPNPNYGEYQTKKDVAERWLSDRIPLSKMKVYDCRRQPGSFGILGVFQKARDQAMIDAHDKVVKFMLEAGTTVQDVDFPELSEGFDLWSACLGKETSSRPFRVILAEGKKGAGSVAWAFKELFLWLFTLGNYSDHTLPAVALAALEAIESLAVSKNKRMCVRTEKLRQTISEVLGDDGVMILPSLPTPAPAHGFQFVLRAAECAATGLINVLEFPSCAIPLGLDEEGLPLGVQVIANHGNDHLCLSVATALEEAGIAGWRPPKIRSGN